MAQLIVRQHVFTTDELLARAEMIAGDLVANEGVAPTDSLVLSLMNGPDHLAFLLAGWMLRLRIVEVPPTGTDRVLAEAMRRTDARVAVVDRDNADRLLATLRAEGGVGDRAVGAPAAGLEETLVVRTADRHAGAARAQLRPLSFGGLADALEDQPSPIFFTSGSTATSKGVILRWPRILTKGRDVLAFYGEPAEHLVAPVLPTSHVYGLYLTLASLARGSSVVLCRESEPARDTFDQLRIADPSVIVCPPLMARFLFGGAVRENTFERLRLISIGGAATPADTVAAIRSHLPTVRLILSYGLVETYSTMCCVDVSAQPDKASSVGPPRWGATVELRDPATGTAVAPDKVGELCIGGAITDGYLGEAGQDRFTADGLLRTGDLAAVDSDGYVHIRGRVKDVFDIGGFTIDPSEIEEIVRAHPEVRDCGAFSASTTRDVIWVAVVLQTEQDESEVKHEILQFCLSRLSPQLVPKRVLVVDHIPRGSLGKIRRGDLREMATVRTGS